MKTAHHHAATLGLAALLALLPALAPAQAIYRIVGPDGRVSFSDKPPASSEKASTLSASGRSGANSGSAELPFELRQLMSRYPVTLYTGDNCDPCNAGRNLLNSRGIPFTERTVKTPMDVEALQQLSGGATVPVLTIGGQRLKGFLNAEWSQYLDAAGYASSSRLPTSYRNPPAAPLVAMPEAPAPSQQPAPAPVQEIAAPPPPPPSNPTGIIF
jgi:glutaredoxin